MSAPARVQPRHLKVTAAVVAVLAAACEPAQPKTTVEDLNWACGERRCSASFRLENPGSDAEALVVRVRAYAGESVQQRRIVGEHRERVALTPRLTKRLAVAVDTSERASRVRVLLEFDPG
jgi:hypothetical protein